MLRGCATGYGLRPVPHVSGHRSLQGGKPDNRGGPGRVTTPYTRRSERLPGSPDHTRDQSPKRSGRKLRQAATDPRSEKRREYLHVQHVVFPQSEFANTDTYMITKVMARAASSIEPAGVSVRWSGRKGLSIITPRSFHLPYSAEWMR